MANIIPHMKECSVTGHFIDIVLKIITIAYNCNAILIITVVCEQYMCSKLLKDTMCSYSYNTGKCKDC